jgi:hypothetical protein
LFIVLRREIILRKFIISLMATIIMCATVLPSISFAQETSVGITSNNRTDEAVISNENTDFYEGLNTTTSTDTMGMDPSVEQQWLGPIFRVVLQAGNYMSKMNRTGKVIKTARNVVATEAHIFSKKHMDGGIMRLGKDQQQVVDRGIDIISKQDDNGKLKPGHNQIWTNINNQPAEIRCYVSDNGQIESFDMFFRAISTAKPGANLIID